MAPGDWERSPSKLSTASPPPRVPLRRRSGRSYEARARSTREARLRVETGLHRPLEGSVGAPRQSIGKNDGRDVVGPPVPPSSAGMIAKSTLLHLLSRSPAQQENAEAEGRRRRCR